MIIINAILLRKGQVIQSRVQSDEEDVNVDIGQTPAGSRYQKMSSKVEESLRFMKACRVDLEAPQFNKVDFFTAHKCLLLYYEEAMARVNSITGKW